jgi:Holliday junction resolvasome RuvABC endonuclease subunit
MKIISIDPGYERMGVAVIEKNKEGKENLIFSECFKTSSKLIHSEKINLIGAEIEKIIKNIKPEAMAIETCFLKTIKKQVYMSLEARGVMLYIAS